MEDLPVGTQLLWFDLQDDTGTVSGPISQSSEGGRFGAVRLDGTTKPVFAGIRGMH